jgi:hypothetical protein
MCPKICAYWIYVRKELVLGTTQNKMWGYYFNLLSMCNHNAPHAHAYSPYGCLSMSMPWPPPLPGFPHCTHRLQMYYASTHTCSPFLFVCLLHFFLGGGGGRGVSLAGNALFVILEKYIRHNI